MIVIADTSPINYLIWIGEIDVLAELYHRILIPPSVHDELKDPRSPQATLLWIAKPPAWLEVRTISLQPDAALLKADLDAGERDAILLAEEIGADELIIDDMRGRKEAARRHLHFVGTVGVLQSAGKKGLLDFKTAVNRLRATSFYIAQDILDRLLKDQES